jgi:hypothetical protein
LAGFSSMALLRLSFSSIKVGDKNIDAGLAPITQIFLNYADRALDRERTKMRLEEVTRIMADVDFDRAKQDLTTLCLTGMQNLSIEEQNYLANEVALLDEAELFNENKAIQLGFKIATLTGLDLLEKSVASLKDSIAVDEEDNGKADHINQQIDEILKEKYGYLEEVKDGE